jgi:CRP-like cAMP-binding protein
MEPIISPKILIAYGASFHTYEAEQSIFEQGSSATFYYQIKQGKIKMAHHNADGQSFIQGIFEVGQSFGEPALFAELNYPCGAIAVEKSEIFKLPVQIFFKLLEENYSIHKKFNRVLSERLSYKSILLNEISSYPSCHRIQTALNYIRNKYGDNIQSFEVPFTRQELADMTGLRVETVIRNIKQMEKESSLVITKGKIIMA